MNNYTNGYGYGNGYGYDYHGLPRRDSLRNNRYLNERNGNVSNPINILNALVRGYNLNMMEYQINVRNMIDDIRTLNNHAYWDAQGVSTTGATHSQTQTQTQTETELRTRAHTRTPTPSTNESLSDVSNNYLNIATALLSYMVYPTSTSRSRGDNSERWTTILSEDTENMVYREEDMGAMTCPITMETILENDELTRIRYCGHTFKKNALATWFARSTRCPVCRHDLNDQDESGRDVSSNELGRDVSSNELGRDDVLLPNDETHTPPVNINRNPLLESTSRGLSQLFRTLNVDAVRYDPSGLLLFEFDLPL